MAELLERIGRDVVSLDVMLIVALVMYVEIKNLRRKAGGR